MNFLIGLRDNDFFLITKFVKYVSFVFSTCGRLKINRIPEIISANVSNTIHGVIKLEDRKNTGSGISSAI